MSSGTSWLDAWLERSTERRLLLLAFLSVAAGYAMVLLVRAGNAVPVDRAAFTPLLAFGASLLLVHLVFFFGSFRGDPVLLATALLLSGLGLLEQFRLGTLDVTRHDKWSTYAFPAGIAVMLAIVLLFRNGRHRSLERTSMFCAVAAIAVLIATIAMGHRFRGAVYASGNLTPTEVIKILMVVFLAGFLAAYRGDLARSSVPGLPAPSSPTVIALGLLWGLPMVLLVWQRDLGMILLLNMTLLVLLTISSGRLAYLVIGLLVCTAAGWAMLRFMPHSEARLLAWQSPFADPTGKGWQILQSLSALYTGGLWGAGLGSGQPQIIPIASSDFVYSALGEEIGYTGCGMILLLYLVFFFRGYRLADSLKDPFSQYLAAGLISVFAFQTLLNVGGVTKAIPLTGITLPFVSHGGSSLVTSFAALGLLLALSEGERTHRAERAHLSTPSRKKAGKKKSAAVDAAAP